MANITIFLQQKCRSGVILADSDEIMTRQEATEFYRKHSGPLFQAALRIVRNADEAEEIMHDALLRYLSRPVRTGSDARTAAWLRTTCVHLAIDRLRKRKRENLFLREYAEDGSQEEPEPLLPVLPDVMQIRSAMERLPQPYGLVLDLVLIEGLDYREISRLTGTKETTLRSLYARGRNKLATLLKTEMKAI